jgi:NhaP-type Na+/H+ or K+/H+ antiporter
MKIKKNKAQFLIFITLLFLIVLILLIAGTFSNPNEDPFYSIGNNLNAIIKAIIVFILGAILLIDGIRRKQPTFLLVSLLLLLIGIIGIIIRFYYLLNYLITTSYQ